MSAKDARASAVSAAMIRWSVSSSCNDSPPWHNERDCFWRLSLPSVTIVNRRTYLPPAPDALSYDVTTAGRQWEALRGRLRGSVKRCVAELRP